jgi:endonuclease/exonuclease/phosphatase (EEP) superfamily protein YafD
MTRGRLARVILVAAVAGLGTAALLPPLSNQNWVFELPAHFAHWTGPIFLLAGSVLLMLRPRFLGVFALALGIWQLSPFVELYWPPARAVADGGVSAYMHNVSHLTKDIAPALDAAISSGADIVVLSEISGRDSAVVARRLGEKYPYFASNDGAESFTIAFWSTIPIARAETVPLSPKWPLNALVVRLANDRDTLSILIGHTQPPLGSKRQAIRDEEWAGLEKLLPQLGRPLIVMGDYNATTGLARFRRLMAIAGLKDSRRGFGMLATWRKSVGFPEFAIDHVYASDDVVVLERGTGDYHNSDHRAVTVRFDWGRGGAGGQAP